MIKVSKRQWRKFALLKFSYSKDIKDQILEDIQNNREPSFEEKMIQSKYVASEISDIFQIAKEKNLNLKEEDYNAVFSYYVDCFSNLLSEMKSKKILPDYKSFSKMLESFADVTENQIPNESILKAYLSCSRNEIEYYFNTKFQQLLSEGNKTEAMNVYKEMEKMNIMFNTKTFNAFMKSLPEKELNLRLKIYEDMLNSQVDPNEETYNLIIDYYLKVEKSYEKAQEIMDIMKTKSMSPSFSTFAIIIDFFSSNSQIDNALELLDRLHQLGTSDLTELYNLIFRNLFSTDNNELIEKEFMKILKDMEYKGISKNNITLALIITYYIIKKEVDLVIKILDAVESQKIYFAPPTYLTIIDFLLENKEFKRSEESYQFLKNRGDKIPIEIFELFLIAYAEKETTKYDNKMDDLRTYEYVPTGKIFISMLKNYTKRKMQQELLHTTMEIEQSKIDFTTEELDIIQKYMVIGEKISEYIQKEIEEEKEKK